MMINSLHEKIELMASYACRKAKFKICNLKKWHPKYLNNEGFKIQLVLIKNQKFGDMSSLAIKYKKQIEILNENVIVSDKEEKKEGYRTYYYSPYIEPLDITQILQVVYTLMNEKLDYIIVSKSYIEFPMIACKNINDVLIYDPLRGSNINQLQRSCNVGRFMRLPAYSLEKKQINIQEYVSSIQIYNEYYLGINQVEFNVCKRTYKVCSGKRPLIFVIPIFFAVGGVERNTVEVMRKLHKKYDFCLITMERHVEQQGSLHYQLQGICNYIFDMREITEHDNYLDVLNDLKCMFHPELVWLCNNSPWFEQHTSQIREIFGDVPIVAQDVYDTKMGWIEYYKNAEVKTFDRYIAITKLIEEVFVNKYNIPREKIDVIYSVVDDMNIRKVKKEGKKADTIWDMYGLDKNKKHFSFVARLTEQKDPIRYLSLVKNVLLSTKENIQFIMVGDGVYKDKVKDFIKDNHMEKQVVCISYIANTPEFIGSLDGLIITSKYEGLPIVCIEAMSMGVPIFSTDTGDTKRFVEQNQSGVIIDERISDTENFIKFFNELEKYKVNAVRHSEEMLDFFSVNYIANQYFESFCKATETMKRNKENEKEK